ncbi:unnamed protein product, partial [Oppiella nova]
QFDPNFQYEKTLNRLQRLLSKEVHKKKSKSLMGLKVETNLNPKNETMNSLKRKWSKEVVDRYDLSVDQLPDISDNFYDKVVKQMNGNTNVTTTCELASSSGSDTDRPDQVLTPPVNSGVKNIALDLSRNKKDTTSEPPFKRLNAHKLVRNKAISTTEPLPQISERDKKLDVQFKDTHSQDERNKALEALYDRVSPDHPDLPIYKLIREGNLNLNIRGRQFVATNKKAVKRRATEEILMKLRDNNLSISKSELKN